MRWRQTGANREGFLAGSALGLAVLTRASLAPFVVLVIVSAALKPAADVRTRVRKLSSLLAPLGLLVGCWMLTTWLATGSPMLTSQSGRFLWIGNNASTFSHYPSESIDASEDQAWASLSPSDLQEIDQLSSSETGQSAWFLQLGWQFIHEHPLETLAGSVRKVWVAFGWVMSPVREPLVELAQGLAYVPVTALALVGVVLARRQIKLLAPIYLLFAAFALVTAVFWAHTSHRSYLDVYLQVLGAYAVQGAMANFVAAMCRFGAVDGKPGQLRLGSLPLCHRRPAKSNFTTALQP